MKRHLMAISISLLYVFTAVSCALIPVSVNYLKIEPDLDKSKKMFSYGLNIVLASTVQDTFVITGAIKKVSITEYRKTVGNLLKATFEKNYRDVTVSDMQQNKGLELVFNRIDLEQVLFSSGVKVGVRFHSELIKDGVFKGELKGKAMGDFSADTPSDIGKAIESSLKSMAKEYYNKYIEVVTSLHL